ncbi:hypothetical protein M408DRAFT_327748 [Serendipita vermifera MAFF 305830]|uniref:DUF6533 domain-containing protein n=1 Tax=Serendipita vermifera MAFF 305830 TaxID=933852 RepID=A0A0C2XP67_SERVB|nr:hypothetical protein M408DRAFT_327748 [Serendipita vermifera MAFF 305830]
MVAPSVSMDEVVSALQQLQISRYLAGVALVLCLYDWILLFGDEYMTIWKTRWTLPKGIYYFNRTVTPIGLIMANFQLSELKTEPLSETVCTVYGYTMGLAELVSFFLCNLLLTLRLVALYKRKRWVCWFLYTFLVISYVIAAVLVVWTFRVYGQTIHYSQMLHVCGSETRSPLMPAIFFVPSVFEFTIFFMTGYRAWQDAKNITSLSSAPFLTILYRDGIIVFFVSFGCRIWNIWIYATQPLASAWMGVYLLWAIMTILSTRVYLNLVYLARKPVIEEHNSTSQGQQFEGRTNFGGIRMRVQTTTVGDAGEIITFGSQESRPPVPLRTFDSNYGIESVVHPEHDTAWNGLAPKGSSVSYKLPKKDKKQRPESALSFVQSPPAPFLGTEKDV